MKRSHKKRPARYDGRRAVASPIGRPDIDRVLVRCVSILFDVPVEAIDALTVLSVTLDGAVLVHSMDEHGSIGIESDA